MQLLWRPAISIGSDLVDTDHQHLMDLVDTLERTLHASQANVSLPRTNEHLEREKPSMRVMSCARVVGWIHETSPATGSRDARHFAA